MPLCVQLDDLILRVNQLALSTFSEENARPCHVYKFRVLCESCKCLEVWRAWFAACWNLCDWDTDMTRQFFEAGFAEEKVFQHLPRQEP